MFGASWLSIKRRNPDRIEYSVSVVYRVGFALIAGLLVLAVASAAERLIDRANIVAYVLLAGSLAAALYDERWLFSPQGLEYRVGLVGLARNRRWTASQVRSVRLVESRQAMGRSLVSLSLAMEDGRALRVDMARGAAGERLREIAQEVAQLVRVPLEK